MSGGLHSLATIIKRLEAATSRLEDLTIAQGNTLPNRGDSTDDLGPSYGAPPAPPAPAPPPPAAVPAPAMAEVPQSVIAFDENVINGSLKKFVTLTNSFAGPPVVEQVQLLEKSYSDVRKVILVASACKKPDQKGFSELLAPLRETVGAIGRVSQARRKERTWDIHLQFVAEAAPSVGWVEIEPKPGPHVKSMKDASEYYGNKIMKEYKEKDAKHVEWVRAYLALLDVQQKYVMEYHTTGLSWNPRGRPLNEYTTAGNPPPPPPPPPPPAGAPPAPSAGGAAAVFAELNRGEEVTKGLRKVDPSQQTHKNPELRASSAVPSAPTQSTPKRPTKPTKPHALSGKKPSKFALEGNKWAIEYHENESSLVVENAELGHVVNLFGCKNSTIQIKGKVNAVTIVNCVKTSVLVDSVISAISITNSPSFALQITGSAPTIQLDSTDSGQIYLSKDCLGVEITTAKCSSINVSLPVEGEDEGVYVERAIPEMLITTVKDGKLVTSIVEHSG
ncbi:hypothetical protein BD410DRAFT_740753 [Rickenella mellea]|uniref:Adenylyl cyclase-associated protein n=1 Tax=Rickenella mellea TaxID=50990 RepID=A0A4Y7QIV5_9AGAM|nr:hypothetical protein BD410DRAFT_740753 [Rickenella mellea]